MMKHLYARLKVELSFTPAYSPWLNGSVERLTGLPASSTLYVIVVPATAERNESRYAHHRTAANFDISDFVLWSRVDQRLPNHKRLGDWVGPFKIVIALPHSFEIEHLVTGQKYDVQAFRLKFYADAELNTTAEQLELVSSQGMLLGVDKFIDHRFNSALNRWELLVFLIGQQAIENPCQPLTTLLQDVPT
ncbi:Hypothetical protein PHPALM_6268 [Phytophthora palmivora]|uniref:Integrase catalytic domain-containing protein n=1 Tax=Phytophthora palmivora TaxID=4796 RepID=A0A2P4YFB1_9STRA|nr:Hypothetical protein PHPALM_6268 [Phytophthora palmivora]